MVKCLLFLLLIVIFTQSVSAQQIWKPAECELDTVATIYIIQYRGEQVVKCVSKYDIKEIQTAVIEYFTGRLYPQMVKYEKPRGFKVKGT